MKEYNDLSKSEAENNISVWMVDNNIRHWKGKIKGPVRREVKQIDTVYEGGEYTIDIVIGDDYPFKPPKVKTFFISDEI